VGVDAVVNDACVSQTCKRNWRRTNRRTCFLVTDEIFGYDAIDGVVEPGCVFGVKEAGPDAQDVILAETTVSFFWDTGLDHVRGHKGLVLIWWLGKEQQRK
jgi:hypothetical protein